ncbi:uncharacterized protein F5147DRAFT_792731 [Suillus discolor]|uniref:Uncharacterized protein n=1 Tax=Suillus discolor TaxID=1912936 RepID=A0A9P7FA96_9AGAM|nr:uncharacterized protein F5147DRAFT_792731 [Suillus discolor]KAG2112074.1 hypothetical protein F5147DRAFT_792731 [Suillus discolor]
MSTPVQSSLADLKASTAQLVGIIAGARHILAGSVDVQLALTKQVTTLLADIIWAHEKGEYIPGIVASCSKKLMRVRSMTPRALPNWHGIGHDDPRVARHAWRKQVRAWEALGDNSCDLPVVPNPSTGPLTVNLPSPPVPSPTPIPSPAPVIPFPHTYSFPRPCHSLPSRRRRTFQQDGYRVPGQRKSRREQQEEVPDDFWTLLPTSKPFVELEDDEDPIVQPILCRVPEVVLPQLSTIVVRTPQLPRSPGSPKKQSFGPASLTAGSRLEVMKSPISCPEARATSSSRPEVEESSDDTSSASDGDPPANTTFDITIPGPNNPCHYCVKEDWPCATHFDKRTSLPCLSCIRCSTKKIKCNPASLGSPPKWTRGKSTTGRTRSKTSAPAPSTAPSPSLSRAQTHSQSHGPSRTPAIPAATTPQVQSRGRSKTITTKKTPAPAPAPAPAPVRSSSFAVPRAALDVPMLDLHSMAIAIRDGAARIAILEARRTVVDQHPSFSLPDTPANATILLDQSGPHPSISPLPSALSNLIDLDISVMQPTPLTVEDGSAMVGLMVEPTQVQPEGPRSSGEIVLPDEPGNLLPESSGNIVVPNEPGNLLPEYDSSDEELDVEGKVDLPGEEVEMAT